VSWFVITLVLLLNFWAAGHALMYKRDPKAAWGWIVTCLLIPTIGPVLYFLLGINRIKTRAKKLKTEPLSPGGETGGRTWEKSFIESFSEHQKESGVAGMDSISRNISNRTLLGGNEVKVLFNGNQAYPEMLEQIEKAVKYVFLATYIFETNRTGRQFVAALSRARERGLDVRVMLDGVGECYSWPRAGRFLKKAGVSFVRFLPPRIIPPSPFLNLRNHRKMLIIDDQVAFTGGMNIGDRHLVDEEAVSGVQDVQFKLWARGRSDKRRLYGGLDVLHGPTLSWQRKSFTGQKLRPGRVQDYHGGAKPGYGQTAHALCGDDFSGQEKHFHHDPLFSAFPGACGSIAGGGPEGGRCERCPPGQK